MTGLSEIYDITIELLAGCTIDDGALAALSLQTLTKKRVVFNHNGIKYRATVAIEPVKRPAAESREEPQSEESRPYARATSVELKLCIERRNREIQALTEERSKMVREQERRGGFGK